jgi:iron complex transport system substrate-binding protein
MRSLPNSLPAIAGSIALVLPIALARPAPTDGSAWTRYSAPPERIVSAALAADELLLELVDPKQIAAVTYLIDDPLASVVAGRAPAHAERIHGPVESMLALRPDRVIVAPYTPAETLTLLSAAGAPVVRLGPHHSFEDVLANVRLLGRATSSEKQAMRLAAKLRARLHEIEGLSRPTPAPRVLAWASGYAFGVDTLVDDCIRRAGGTNVVVAGGEVTLSIEGALGLDPDIIVVSTHEPVVRQNAPELLGDLEAWRATRAVAGGRVHGVPAAWLGSVSHHAILALDALAALLRSGREDGQ